MVHEALSLYANNDTYTFVPSFLDPSVPPQNLVINRDTGSFRLDRTAPEPSSPTAQAEVLTVYGIFGVIKLISGEYLLVITERERIGKLGGAHDIFRAKQIKVLPIIRSTKHLSEIQIKDEARFLFLIEAQLKADSYYFSYTYDLTHTLQRQAQFGDLENKPLWERADQRFFWNRYLQSKLIDLTEESTDQNMSDYILPIMFGFVEITPARINNRDIVFILISRTRFFSRGIDANGNVSNFNETEQIVLLDPIRDGYPTGAFEGKIKLSYVQTRGSIPIYWAQISNIKYVPKLQIMDLPHTNETARRHFDEQIRIYGEQILVNLVNNTGYEYPIAMAYEKAVKSLNDPRLHYLHFDFHHECRKMRWDRIQILIDKIEEELLKQGYFYSEQANSSVHTHRLQASVVRTNCMDCLDRTNVVQSALAKWVLTQQLREVGVLSNKERIDEIQEFMHVFSNVWADNADAVSIAYSGTGALKTDYTRTGKRSAAGAIQDFQYSITRYIKNNFMDGSRQDAFDLLLGNYITSAHSPFVDTNPAYVKSFPQAIFILILLSIFTMIVPQSEEYPNLNRLLFWGTILLAIFLIHFMIKNGSDFIDWPILVPPEYRYYQGPTITASSKFLQNRRQSELMEYGEKIELQKIE